MIQEVVRIISSASMNSKREFGSYKIARIQLEPSEWENKMALEQADKVDKLEKSAMLKLRANK